MSSKTRTRSNKVQLQMLIEYMMTHKNFANGEYSGPMGATQNLKQWEELKSLLSEHGPDKTVEQWRHTWRDLKKKAREEGAHFKKASTATGNNTQLPVLSESTEKILSIIGQAMAFGIGQSEESGVGSFITQTNSQNDSPTLTVTEATCASTSTSDSANFVVEEPTPLSITQTTTANANVRRVSVTPHVPVAIPPPTAAPQRRVGLGDRAREFLAAEEATTAVLRDILNTFQAQNERLLHRHRILGINEIMKQRQHIREERLKQARKY